MKTLADYRGRKLILYFYPKDNTPGVRPKPAVCATGGIRCGEWVSKWSAWSPDSEKSHQGFIAKQGLNFTLLADTDKKMREAYGVWGEKKFMGRTFMGILRTTFVIDEQGVIEKIFDKVRTKDHFEQIVEAYQ